MASKHKMGYKCRIAGVLLLLLTSIAALIAVAVIQDTWKLSEYTKEVNTYMHQHNSHGYKYKHACCYTLVVKIRAHTADVTQMSGSVFLISGSDETHLAYNCTMCDIQNKQVCWSHCHFPFSFHGELVGFFVHGSQKNKTLCVIFCLCVCHKQIRIANLDNYQTQPVNIRSVYGNTEAQAATECIKELEVGL